MSQIFNLILAFQNIESVAQNTHSWQLDEGKAFAENNKSVFDVAIAVAKFYQEQLDLRMDAYERERKSFTIQNCPKYLNL